MNLEITNESPDIKHSEIREQRRGGKLPNIIIELSGEKIDLVDFVQSVLNFEENNRDK